MSIEELHAMGLSEAPARWMLARYREQALAIARSDPFRLAEEVPGVGFATADEIAARLGLKEDAPGRLRAGTLRALRDAADEGHTCLARNRLVQEAQALLQVERRLVARTIDEMAGEGAVIAEGPAPGIERDPWVYLPSLQAAEVGTGGIQACVGRVQVSRVEYRSQPNIITLGREQRGSPCRDDLLHRGGVHNHCPFFEVFGDQFQGLVQLVGRQGKQHQVCALYGSMQVELDLIQRAEVPGSLGDIRFFVVSDAPDDFFLAGQRQADRSPDLAQPDNGKLNGHNAP